MPSIGKANGSTNGHRPPDAAASEDVDPTVEMPVPATERAAEPDAGALLSCRGIDMAYGPVQIAKTTAMLTTRTLIYHAA